MTSFRLRYKRDSTTAERLPTLTYPLYTQPGYPTRERAEQVLAAMPEPGRMEIVCEEDSTDGA